MSEPGNRPVVIVGAGYSGTLAAVNLLRESRGEKLQLVLIEREAAYARGLAYRGRDDAWLLNVPAGNMSALAHDADDFVRYCQAVDPQLGPASFVPRHMYGDYLEHVLQRAESENPGVLEKVAGEVVAVRPLAAAAGFEVELADGRSWTAAQVVLAFGHAPPKKTWPGIHAGYIDNPWDGAALDGIPPTGSVLILGTGHTAIDTMLRLAEDSDQRKFYLLSRRGLLPQAHRLSTQPLAAGFPHYLHGIPLTLPAHFRALRAEITRRRGAGGDWRDVLNALRPHIPTLWARLSLAERKRFLRHAAPYWDVHRHRLAPSAHTKLQALLNAGRAEVIAGRTLAYESDGSGIAITIRERRTTSIRELTAGTILNCTGPNYDIDTLASPLIVQLRNAGLLQPDVLHIGLEVDDGYQVIDRQQTAVPGLYYLGPMLRARYWEATAVPELRGHALQLAHRLLAARQASQLAWRPGMRAVAQRKIFF